MAFPGGRMERHDRHGLDVAARETAEEIGVDIVQGARCLGRLSDIMTHFSLRRRAMVVTPYVFELQREQSFVPNYEVAEVIWVPLRFLLNPANREQMTWNRGKVKIPLPCYMYKQRRIWGLSLMMLDEFMGILE